MTLPEPIIPIHGDRRLAALLHIIRYAHAARNCRLWGLLLLREGFIPFEKKAPCSRRGQESPIDTVYSVRTVVYTLLVRALPLSHIWLTSTRRVKHRHAAHTTFSCSFVLASPHGRSGTAVILFLAKCNVRAMPMSPGF